jgi:hypothetical protein
MSAKKQCQGEKQHTANDSKQATYLLPGSKHSRLTIRLLFATTVSREVSTRIE